MEFHRTRGISDREEGSAVDGVYCCRLAISVGMMGLREAGNERTGAQGVGEGNNNQTSWILLGEPGYNAQHESAPDL